jgi:ABC-type transport system involved in cytochrome c biogenesis permease component
MFRLILSAVFYCVGGNLMSSVLTVSVSAALGDGDLRIVAVAICALLLYTMMFTAGYNDGSLERRLLTRKDTPPVKHWRWWIAGGVAFALMAAICLLMAFGVIESPMFRLFAAGSAFMLINIAGNPLFALILYAVMIPCCYVGFRIGLAGTIEKDKFMYE